MNLNYNQNYSYEEIAVLLKRIKECIVNDNYILSQNENRKENMDFIREYNIYSSKQKAILLNIQVEDFCHSLKNTKPGYEYETLYVFAPHAELYHGDDRKERVQIYTKFNIIRLKNGERVVVISFHPFHKPIKTLFQQDKRRLPQSDEPSKTSLMSVESGVKTNSLTSVKTNFSSIFKMNACFGVAECG